MESPKIRTERPEDEGALAALLDATFESVERESRLWSLLRTEPSLYDPDLAWVAESGGELVGALLLQPRELLLRGVRVPAAIINPLAVAPAHQGQGIGSHLLRTVLQRVGQRYHLLMLIGDPNYFGRFGFERIFGQCRLTFRPAPPASDEHSPAREEWRAIRAEDLGACDEIYRYCYSSVCGAEVRTLSALDWDSAHSQSHTVVFPTTSGIDAYLRFRPANTLRVLECGLRNDAGREKLLRFMQRLCAEHQQEFLEVQIPTPHPLYRPLLRAGGQAIIDDFAGACMARTPSPLALLRKLLDLPHPLHKVDSGKYFNLDTSGRTIHVHVRGNRVRCSDGAGKGPTLHVQSGCWMGLMSGLEPPAQAIRHERGDGREEVLEILERLLPPSAAMWIASAVQDLIEA